MGSLFTIVNFWAVLVSAIAAFVLGAIWYSKFLFGGVWCRASGLSESMMTQKPHGAGTLIAAFVLMFLAAFVFALMLGAEPPFGYAVFAGFMTGLFFVATSFGVNYLFADRGLKLFLIDGVYHVLQFTLYGVVLGLWHGQ
jgi:hypothetical protein